MKTAVSIPDEVFQQAEEVARRLNKSRSQLYAEALAEYLAKREPASVTAAIDAAIESLEEAGESLDDGFVRAASKRTLESSEW